ncbi:MAG TPA: serine/threonine-protein kinase [Pirellulaceae bacterium]|nr:serine/threonine-protein kinase [Pirellulaceae bacterium]
MTTMIMSRVKTLLGGSEVRRFRHALEKGTLPCEGCSYTFDLSAFAPLQFHPCPKCGLNHFIPYHLGEFLLYKPLGLGGTASVYKAIHRAREKELFAVKVLRTDRDYEEQEIQAFEYEAAVHRAVHPHPRIVPFIDSGRCNDEPYHAMQFLEAEGIKKKVADLGRIPERTAVGWILQLLEALIHVRNRGFLYRDVSPSNALILPDQSLILIDFGLALPLDEADREQANAFVEGTAEFIPPERIQGLGEDERSVIYSLGHLLFFMLNGEPLVKGASRIESAMKHVKALRVAFNERMLPETTEALAYLVGKMLHPDPGQRPDSFEILDKLLRGIPLP